MKLNQELRQLVINAVQNAMTQVGKAERDYPDIKLDVDYYGVRVELAEKKVTCKIDAKLVFTGTAVVAQVETD
jgi:nitrogen-specific signal transduction histidine kinase